MDDKLVADTRAFNRFYTRLIGVLEEHIVDSTFSLAEARVLYEISARSQTSAAELSRELGLDQGYMSRILRRLVSDGRIAFSPAPRDRRQNRLALTPEGDEAASMLAHRSDLAVSAMLEDVAPEDREVLSRAFRTIRRLLGDDLREAPILLRPHRVGELGWLIYRQAVLYNRQFGWNGEFETLIARIYHEYEVADESPPKALWVADRGEEVMGSVFVTPVAGRETMAQLRMLYVEPEARGAGVGRTLVQQAVGFARQSGYAGIRLWTQSVLTSARRIYAGEGFQLVEQAPHHSFGHDLVGEYWELGF